MGPITLCDGSKRETGARNGLFGLQLTRSLAPHITTPDDVRKITGENWLRVLEKAKAV